MSKFLIIDANSIINRAYYAIRPLTNNEGLHTHGIYGFLNILLKEISEENPDYIACAFDVSRVTFRKEIYSEYKATRGDTPDDLKEQFEPLKKLLHAMNIKTLEMQGYEADDIIGSVSKKCSDSGVNCVILTGDKDDLQLIDNNVFVKLIVTKMGKTETTLMDEKALFEKYGLTPQQMIELKALMGDKSDNIPGVKGIGEVSGINLIKQYGSLENIYENISEIKASLKSKLEDDKDNAFLSRKIGTIKRDMDIVKSFDEFLKRDYDNEKLIEILDFLNFEKFKERMGLSSEKKVKADITILGEKEFNELSVNNEFYFIVKENEAYINYDEKVFIVNCENEKLISILSDKNVKKNSFDIKSLMHRGFGISGDFSDIGIKAYVCDPKYGFADFFKIFSLLDLSIEDYNEAIFYLPSLNDKLNEIIKKDNLLKINEMEHSLINILYDMENEGIKIDVEKLENLRKDFQIKADELLNRIYILAGEEFNVLSPKQLGEILFVKLGLPVIKKTKTGYSTNAEVLEALTGTHEIIDYIKEYRTLTKLISTYIEGFINTMDDEKIIHTTFNQTLTNTGRLSSTEPNLQNIPVRTPEGRKLRSVVVPKNDLFVAADYSQIELRVLADISGDENLKEAFLNNLDIHTSTAQYMFDTGMVTPEMRRAAKAINFGLIYGKGAFSLAKDLKITRKEANLYIERYLGQYPNVKEYMKNVIDEATEKGYTVTEYGRRRYFPELKAKGMQRAAGERAALNSPIQGTAADIIKIAMIKVYNALKEEKMKSKLVLQIHDELIIDCYNDEKEKVKELLQKQMENAVRLNVPLTVSIGEGTDLNDCK